MKEALAVLGGYLLGSLPFGYWVPKLVRGEDIRTKGSGNVGASNVFRVYGRSLGVPVALLDLAKGFAAASLGLWLGGALFGVLAAAAAMLGHARPVFLRFEKGGKMVATAGGALVALAPLAAFICIARVARRLRRDPLCLARLDRDGASRSRSSSSSSTTRGRSSCSGSPGRRRSSCCIAQNIRRLRGRTEHRFELGR